MKKKHLMIIAIVIGIALIWYSQQPVKGKRKKGKGKVEKIAIYKARFNFTIVNNVFQEPYIEYPRATNFKIMKVIDKPASIFEPAALFKDELKGTVSVDCGGKQVDTVKYGATIPEGGKNYVIGWMYNLPEGQRCEMMIVLKYKDGTFIQRKTHKFTVPTVTAPSMWR